MMNTNRSMLSVAGSLLIPAAIFFVIERVADRGARAETVAADVPSGLAYRRSLLFRHSPAQKTTAASAVHHSRSGAGTDRTGDGRVVRLRHLFRIRSAQAAEAVAADNSDFPGCGLHGGTEVTGCFTAAGTEIRLRLNNTDGPQPSERRSPISRKRCEIPVSSITWMVMWRQFCCGLRAQFVVSGPNEPDLRSLPVDVGIFVLNHAAKSGRQQCDAGWGGAESVVRVFRSTFR